MHVIHKQQFEINGRVILTVPMGSWVLDIQVQDGKPTIWYMFDKNSPQQLKEKIELMIAPTGYVFDVENFIYFKTIQIGSMVWHIFKE